ncbi:MAG: hypothetical protein EHM35_03815, partial [Planctomycetaceae bacterium]
MPYLVGNIPYFGCYVRREYTRNLEARHGEFIPAIAHGVRCVRGSSLWLHTILMEDGPPGKNTSGGSAFLVPIEALCHLECAKPNSMDLIQPWDCFSSDFGVAVFDFITRGACYVLPDRVPAQYRFTIDFTGSDLADDPEQHKHLHICLLEGGLIGAFPNNRLLFRDDAFWKLADSKPDFVSLAPEFRAEGHQYLTREPQP